MSKSYLEKRDKKYLNSRLEFWKKSGSVGLIVREATKGDIGRFQVALDILLGEDDILLGDDFDDEDEEY